MNACEYQRWHMIKTTKSCIPKRNEVTTNCRLLRTPFNANTDFNQCNRDRRSTGEAAGRPAPIRARHLQQEVVRSQQEQQLTRMQIK
jgi:hypothetical protein